MKTNKNGKNGLAHLNPTERYLTVHGLYNTNEYLSLMLFFNVVKHLNKQ